MINNIQDFVVTLIMKSRDDWTNPTYDNVIEWNLDEAANMLIFEFDDGDIVLLAREEVVGIELTKKRPDVKQS